MSRHRIFFRSLLFRWRRMHWGFVRVLLAVAAVILIISSIYSWIDGKLYPSVKAISGLKAVSLATEVINQAVHNEFRALEPDSSLVHMDKDAGGNVTAIHSDIPEMNIISARMAIRIAEELNSLKRQTIQVPLGVLTAPRSFAGMGLNVDIQVVPAGNVKTDFKSELTEAGINQTRYRLYLEVKCKIRVVGPMVDDIEEVCTNVPLMETIIVGKVPQTYVGINSST